MKILIVSHEYPPVGGGGSKACLNIAQKYAEAGNEVHIVTVWFEGQKEYEQIDYAGKVIIHRLKSKRQYMDHCSFMEMLDYLMKALPVVNKLQKKNKYDVCQVFFGIPSGPIGYYLNKKYKLPYVIRFGGGDIPGSQDRFKTIYKLISPFLKIIWKNADGLVANSRDLQDRAKLFYDKKPIVIIPNGSDVPDVKSIEKDGNTIRLLFVSRLLIGKGIQDILHQIKEVKEKCVTKGKRLEFWIVGDGPYRAELQQMVEEIGLTDTVTFWGFKTKAELEEYYLKGDIFVFPSRHEGMPNVVLEAMSYGLPILMTPCGGSDELIDGNGYVVTSDRFGEMLIHMIDDSDTTREQGLKSIKRVQNELSWDNAAGKYLTLFEEIRK